MTRDRFLEILRNLHFCNNEAFTDEDGRDFKVQELVKHWYVCHLSNNEKNKSSPWIILGLSITNLDKFDYLKFSSSFSNKVFKAAMNPAAIQSIDEHMVKFKGQLSWKQYLPKKPIKWGIKMWNRCSAQTGYCYEIQLYLGTKCEISIEFFK